MVALGVFPLLRGGGMEALGGEVGGAGGVFDLDADDADIVDVGWDLEVDATAEGAGDEGFGGGDGIEQRGAVEALEFNAEQLAQSIARFKAALTVCALGPMSNR